MTHEQKAEYEEIPVQDQQINDIESQQQENKSYMNNVFQHVMLFIVISLTSGAFFCLIPVYQWFEQNDMKQQKYDDFGYILALCVFAISGFLLHLFVLGKMLQKISFETVMLIGFILFCLGLGSIMLSNVIDWFIIIADILLPLGGCIVYVLQFCLFPNFKYLGAISSCAFATSTLILQLITCVNQYILFGVWIALVIISAILYKPVHSDKVSAQTCKKESLIAALLQYKLYPTYAIVCFGTAVKAYYQNTFFARLSDYGINYDYMDLVYTFANFSSVLSGLFDLLDFRIAHCIGTIGSIVFNIILLTSHTLVASCINLFLMNIGMTIVITASLLICATQSKYFESNSLTYLSLLIGDLIALAGNQYEKVGFNKMDQYIVIPFLIIQVISLIINLFVYKQKE